MTIVKELNELAKKMTGTNPRARTDAQALDYIEQHYQGGDTPQPTPQSKFDYIIPSGLYDDTGDGEIKNQDILAVLNEIKDNYLDENGNIKPLMIGMYIANDDQGNNAFIQAISIIKNHLDNSPQLYFISVMNDKVFVNIYYSANKWRKTCNTISY